MTAGDLPREPGEDLVKWRNRCLRARGRNDIQWRYREGGSMGLEHTRPSSKLDRGELI